MSAVVCLRSDPDQTRFEVFLSDRDTDPATVQVPAEGRFDDRDRALAYAAELATANECGCWWVD